MREEKKEEEGKEDVGIKKRREIIRIQVKKACKYNSRNRHKRNKETDKKKVEEKKKKKQNKDKKKKKKTEVERENGAG